MFTQSFKNSVRQLAARLLALAGSFFIQMFGGQHHHYNAGPVGNGVAEKRAPVLLLIAYAVEHNPCQQNASGYKGKAVPFKKCLVPGVTYRSVAYGKFQILSPQSSL